MRGPSRWGGHTPERLALSLAALAVLLTVPGTLVATAYGHTNPVDVPFALGFAVTGVASALTGAVVAARVPDNAVGWLILGLGVGVGVLLASGAYADVSLAAEEPFPSQDLAAWLGDVSAIPVFFGFTGFLLLLFPSGHLVSPRWRVPAWCFTMLLVLATISYGMLPGTIGNGGRNPFAVGGTAGDVVRLLSDVTDVLALPAMATAAFALFLRMRRSRGVERQQLKAFTFVAIIGAVGLGTSIFSGGVLADINFATGLFGFAALPVTAGVAILRYRLYEVDVVIKRTLVYGTLAAVLAGTYLFLVLTLQALLPVSGENDLAVAASTLAVAALFRPLRRRIQSVVDRRFYRTRYDAVRTLDGFGARLRDQVDLEVLGGDLRSVVRDTMQPEHVSLWLRGTPR